MDCRIVDMSSGLGEMFPLREGMTTVGRDSDNDIQLMSEDVSRHHVKFNNLPSVCQVEDMGSTNGTQVNGEAIEGIQALKHGDVVRIGAFMLRFEQETAGISAETTSPSREYSDRTQFDTIRISKKHPDEGLGEKTKTSSMTPVKPLKPRY